MRNNSELLFHKENDLLSFAEEENNNLITVPEEKWKLMIVDDEKEVHDVTKLVLNKFQFEGKSLEFVSAFSGEEAKRLMQQHPDTALILLDVVMEEDDSGLQVVKYIREELKNNLVRIILRTGQPGQSPEEKVIIEYDINDYKAKTELTSQKLFTTIVTALRSYRDLSNIDNHRKGLRMVIDSFSSIFSLSTVKEFAAEVLEKLVSILQLNNPVVQYQPSGFVVCKENDTFKILSATGCYHAGLDKSIEQYVSEKVMHLLNEAYMLRKNIYYDDHFVLYLQTNIGPESLIYIENSKKLSELEKDLIDIYSSNISAVNEAIFTSIRYESEKQQRLLAETLRELNKRITSTLDEKEVMKRLLDSLSQIISYDCAVAALRKLDGFEVFIKKDKTIGNKKDDLYCETYENEILSEIVATGCSILISDIYNQAERTNCFQINTDEKNSCCNFENVRSILGVPIVHQNKPIGVVLLKSCRTNAFSKREEDILLTFTEQIAIAIENAHLFSEVKHLAMTDELTGFYTRRRFFELADKECTRARLCSHPLSLLLIDVDHFKDVNDTFGHIIGDEVLETIANRCRLLLRETDIFGRYGGEEFVALLPEVKCPKAIADRLRKGFESEPITLNNDIRIPITVSIGIATLTEQCTMKTLFEKADKALYKAKQSGRNCVVEY